MAVPSPLSEEQITQIRADIGHGRQPVVWFTPAAVGVPAGRSAKVVAIHEPAEGDFIQVRPTGSTDVLSFSSGELTLVKPSRRREVSPPAPKTTPSTAAAPLRRSVPAERVRQPVPPRQEVPAAKARPRPPAPVTITMTSTPEGEWSVEVLTGAKRVVRAQPVTASSVAQAAKALGHDVAAAIDGALTAARELQQSRIERLEAELEAARHALSELTG